MKMSKQNKRDRMKRVFCMGNGTSRQRFDLEQLRPHAKYMVVMLIQEILNQMF